MLERLKKTFAVTALSLVAGAASAAEQANTMTYELAEKAMNASEAYARDKGWKVMVMISDHKGLPVMLRRIDGTSDKAFGYITGKTLVVTQTGLSSGEYAERLKRGEIEAIEGSVNYKGGVPVYIDGDFIGSISTSGVADYKDREVSLAGAELIGVAAKPE